MGHASSKNKRSQPEQGVSGTDHLPTYGQAVQQMTSATAPNESEKGQNSNDKASAPPEPSQPAETSAASDTSPKSSAEEQKTIWIELRKTEKSKYCQSSVLKPITLPTTASFEDFQRAVQQQLLTYTQTNAMYGAEGCFVWTNWLLRSGFNKDGTEVVDEANWTTLRTRILEISTEHFARSSDRLVVEVVCVMWTEPQQVKSTAELDRLSKVYEKNQNALLRQGRYVPPPELKGPEAF